MACCLWCPASLDDHFNRVEGFAVSRRGLNEGRVVRNLYYRELSDAYFKARKVGTVYQLSTLNYELSTAFYN
jgi:hypothetical protein